MSNVDYVIFYYVIPVINTRPMNMSHKRLMKYTTLNRASVLFELVCNIRVT